MPKNIEIKLSLIEYIDNNIVVVYSPALNLYGYGYDKEEASLSFNVMLSEYFRYTLQNKTLLKDLEKHGWKIKQKENTISPNFMQLITKNKELKNIMEHKAFKKYDLSYQVPA